MTSTRSQVKYDSKFEKEAHEIMQSCEYHPEKRIFYLVPKQYEPDFVYTHHSKTWYIEAKGRFRTSEEARKYVIIAETLSPKEELVFLFQRANTPMPGSRRRKDGTRYTMEEWAEKHGFRWYTLETIPTGWRR
jgi:predicted nuclease of restriction endonuclease-like RecB superfamily